jgi:hypothetical protein
VEHGTARLLDAAAMLASVNSRIFVDMASAEESGSESGDSELVSRKSVYSL